MTATAFSLDPAPDFEAPFDHSIDAPGLHRPQLHVLDGGRPAATPTRPSLDTLETYRRRRFLALVALTVVVLAVTQLAGISVLSFQPGATAPVDAATPAVHVVRPGDSYAAIAATLGAERPAVAAEQLRVANGGAELVVGQRLVVDRASLGGGSGSS